MGVLPLASFGEGLPPLLIVIVVIYLLCSRGK